MRLSHQEVAKIILGSFRLAFTQKDQGKLKDNPSFRSAYFVSCIGKKLQEHFENQKENTKVKVHYQFIDDIMVGKKIGGEWLFDICVTSTLKLIDKRHKDGKSVINTNLLFACESEYGTSLTEFATDFGKLVCSNANQFAFIQGLNQKKNGRKSFIESRKKIIETQLCNTIKDDFVLAFIPTPGSVEGKSYWDNGEEVLTWASVWLYSVSDRKFCKI